MRALVVAALAALAASAARAELPPDFEARLLARWPELAIPVADSPDPVARCHALLKMGGAMRAALRQFHGISGDPSYGAAAAEFEWTNDRAVWDWIMAQGYDRAEYERLLGMYGSVLSGMDDTLDDRPFYRRDRDDCLALTTIPEE